MPDQTYQPKIFRDNGGDRMTIKSSGTLLVETGGLIDLSTVTGLISFAAGEIAAADLASSAVIASKLDATLRKGFVPLSLFTARIISSTAGENFSSANGGLLSSGSSPLLTLNSTQADRSPYIQWTSAVQTGVQFASVPVPYDYTTASAITLDLLYDKGSTLNQTMNIDCQFWPGLGQTESGTVTAALTAGSTQYTEISVTVAAATAGVLSSNAGQWTVALVPGAHANDPLRLYGAKLTYTKQST